MGEKDMEETKEKIKSKERYLQKELKNTRDQNVHRGQENAKELEGLTEILEKTRIQAIRISEVLRCPEFAERPADLEQQKPSADIWAKYSMMNQRIEAQQEDGINVREVTATYNSRKNKLEQLTKKNEKSRQNLEGFQADIKRRKKKNKDFRKTISKLLNITFKRYMAHRGHRGTLKVDFEEKELSFDVKVAGNKTAKPTEAEGEEPAKKKQKGVTDTKTLSGGERAFTTVAFLLALGQVLDCPVRAMDEFDCFMDAANRNVSIDQMIDFAKMQSTRQFLFLTPLSLTNSIQKLEGDPRVQVVSLKKLD